MLEDAASELSRVLSFSKTKVDENAVKSAAEASDFKNMQTQEAEQYNGSDVLPDSNPSRQFMRSGKSGGWEDHFSSKQLTRFLSRYGDLLKDLGYPVSQ